jgi:hypothetical protein
MARWDGAAMPCAVKDGSALLTDLFVFSEPVPAVVSLIERAVMTVCEDRSNLYNNVLGSGREESGGRRAASVCEAGSMRVSGLGGWGPRRM